MPAHQPVPDEALVEKFDHVRARDVEQLGGLLGGQLRMRRDHGTPWPAAMFAKTSLINSRAAPGR